jgi:conjugative transfer region lipoprotein (TIGR03751 family)
MASNNHTVTSMPRSLATLGMVVVLSALASGCSLNPNRKSPLPTDGLTIAEVYDNFAVGAGAAAGSSTKSDLKQANVARVTEQGQTEYKIEQRKLLSDPINNRFERLPNPDLVMFVFPHLSQGRYPVPGYQTLFPMYESVHYALPGEVPPRLQASTPPVASGIAVAQSEYARKTNYFNALAASKPDTEAALRELDSSLTARCAREVPLEELIATATNNADFTLAVKMRSSKRSVDSTSALSKIKCSGAR